MQCRLSLAPTYLGVMKVLSQGIENGMYVHIMLVEDASESHLIDGDSNFLLQGLDHVDCIDRL